jgi:hypothetical protein
MRPFIQVIVQKQQYSEYSIISMRIMNSNLRSDKINSLKVMPYPFENYMEYLLRREYLHQQCGER